MGDKLFCKTSQMRLDLSCGYRTGEIYIPDSNTGLAGMRPLRDAV